MDLRRRSKLRRVERTLAAAREILREEGEDGLQMRVLAERAELSVRTLYNHFGSKADVVTALTARALDELSAELETLAIHDGVDLSRAIVTVSIARFHADRAWLRPLLSAAFAGAAEHGGAALHQQARALQERALAQAMAEGALTPDVAPRHLAHQILCAYNEAAGRWALGHLDRSAFETQVLHAWTCLLLGFARSSTRTRLLRELRTLEHAMPRTLRAGNRRRSAPSGGANSTSPRRR